MLAAMQLLNQAIATVLLEIERGFATRRNAGGTTLAVERIRLTLNFTLDTTGQTASATPDGPHSVTVEFKVGDATPSGPLAVAAAPVTFPPAEGDIILALTPVFGAPGFDSSARATVFCETFASRSHEQACAAVAALGTPLPPGTDDITSFAAQMLRGIIQSGPAKLPARGEKLLEAVLHRYPLEEVLRVVEQTWKTQDDWL